MLFYYLPMYPLATSTPWIGITGLELPDSSFTFYGITTF